MSPSLLAAKPLIISSNGLAFRFAFQRAYQECCHPAPRVAICPRLGVPFPKEVAPPAHPILHQLRLAPSRPAGPSKQRGQGAPALR